MRKYNLILIALMALIFVSCSENETVMSIPEEANAVLFDTYTGRAPQTRGVEMTDTKLQEDHFGVLGYYTAQTVWSEAAAKATPNFMYNQEVVYDSGWKYTPIKYWPTAQNDKVSFFAYAPYENTPTEALDKGIILSGNAAEGTPTIKFTVQSKPEDMVDLVTANALDKGNKVNNEDKALDPTVSFKFNHVLSRVEFKAKASELLFDTDDASKKTYINIKSAQLNSSSGNSNLYQSATYTFGNTDTDKGSWASGNTPFSGYKIDGVLATNTALFDAIATFIGADATNSYTESEKAIKGVMIGEKTATAEGVTTHSAISIFKKDAPNNQYLFFIPAIKEVATDDDGLREGVATVTFDYDIVTLDKNLAKGFSVTSASKEVALPANTLKQGVAYTYTFTFNVDKVEVTATVADWDSKEEKEVKVDYTDKL